MSQQGGVCRLVEILTHCKISARKKVLDPTYYTSQGIISGNSQMFGSVEGRSTPTGLESASTVRSNISYY